MDYANLYCVSGSHSIVIRHEKCLNQSILIGCALVPYVSRKTRARVKGLFVETITYLSSEYFVSV